MSYYNPFEDSSTYYNPYKQQQVAPQSLTSTLIDVAKNMAVYGGLFVLGSAAAKAASSRIGRFIKKGSFGKASSIAKKLDNPTVGSILKNTSLGREYTAYKESTGLFKASQARQAYLSKVAKEQPYRLGVARITSAFKNPTTFAATIGGIWKQNVLTGLGVSFAIDKMSGNYQAIVSEKKEWYDVPGQIGNLTKWFANESIYASAFGLLGPAAKGAASIGLVGIKKTFDGPMGKYIAKSLSQVSPGLQHINGQTRFFKDKILENARSEHDKTFLAKAIRWGQNFSTSINMNFQNLNAATRAASFGLVDAFKQQGNFGKKIGTALAPISKAIQQIREINARADKIRSERLVDTRIDLSGIRALEAAHAIAADAGISNVITKDSLDEQIMSIRESMKAKQTFLEQMLPGAKRVRNKDVVSKEWVREQVQSLRKRYDNKSAGRFMREILNMNVGENVYKIDNKIVNLNGFSPMNLLRKFISPVLDKEIRLPLTGFKFSLGEITMVDSLLTHNPRLDFFVTNDLKNKYSEFIGGITDPPMFSTNKELREEGIYTIADAMRKQESNVALFTRGGNWSFFGNKEPKTIVTGKELNYSPKSGRFRYSETNEIIIQQLLSEGYSPSEISNKLEGTGKPKTRFGRFVNKMGFGMPSKITDGIRFINNIIEGKNKGYNTAIKNIFENTDINFNIKPSLMVLDDINAHTAQILAQIIKNPKAVEIITSNKKYGNLSDLSNILNSEVHLIEKLSDPDFLKDMWKYDKNLRRDIETVKSYPSIARKHEQVKSLGGLSSMTSIDKLRVAYVDHVLNNQFLDYIDNGNGYHHPLLDAIPKLKEGNYITDKQAKALELHAKLSSLQDLSRRNITEGIANTDPNGRSLWTEMMKNEKQYGLNLHNDLLNFISENKLRRTNLNRYEQRLIQPGNNLERFINNTPYYSSGRGIAGIGQYLGASVDRLTELMGEWTPFKRDPVKHLGIFGGAKYLGGTVLKLAAVTGAYRVADSMIAANPIFEGSGLDDGITGFTADQLAKARLFSSKVGDTLGITGAMKYLNGLMPGSTSTFPGLIAGAAMANYMKASPLGMIKAMAAGAVINRIANPYLPDFSKSYEQLRKEYSGEEQVPFMKSPTWLLGSTPWEGTGVAGYQPNWYVRAKSRWESSDTLYGSEFRRLIHKPLFPLGINIGDFIDPYYMERCVTKDTKILTDQSTLVEIKDVRVGDKIHTHNNSIQTVLEKWEKEIDEDVVVLRTAFSNIPNRTTIEHRYFAVKSNTCPKRKGNRLSICFDKNWLKCKNCKYSYYRNYKSDWYRADELEKGDFLIYPRIKIKHKDCSILIHDQNKYNTKKIQKTLPKTNDLYRLFGYYLAEGHCDARSVVFDFHSDEIVYHNDVLSIFKNIFNINGTKYIDGNKTRLIFYNAILSRFFKLTFGTNCYNKTIPDNILHSNDELLKELIIGYFRGDGSDCLDSALTCVSVSENLIFQIRSILFSIGYIPAYYFDDRSARNEACGHILYVYGNNINELRRLIGFDIKKEPKEPKWYYIDDNYIYIKIKEVSFEKYSDVVVDIKVSNSHSFLGILASYHNSHYFDRPYPKCLFGSAKVVTVNGIKKIKDIDIGDYVYDINGSVTKVINVLKRKVNDNDTIFSMRVIGQEEDLILTSDHKIPIIRDKKCIFKSQHNKSCTGNDEGICRYCTKKRKDFDISWVEAKDINIGDFLVKKPINPEYLGSTIDISLYVQRPFDIKENKIFIKDKLGRYTGDSFNRYWDIDNDLAYYFGLYLSEGWLGKQRGKYISVNTVHNKKEFDHINRIINNISKKYNLKFSYKDFGTHVNFYIFDYIFSDIIYGLFNCGSATKSVKFFTKELDRKILAGLFYGDGHYDKTHVVLTSINMNLINFATIVLENDFISTCLKKHCDNGHQSYRLSFSYSYLDDYRLLFDINHKNENILTSNKKLHLIYFRNGYLLKRIIKKEEIEYNDFLYDLTVESPTHSFSLYEFIVHNSGRLFSEVPIIGEMLAPIGRILKPEKTMHQEFLQGEWAGTTDGTNPSLASVPPPTYQQNMIMMNKGNGARSMGNVSFNGGNYTIGTVTPWSKVIQGRLAGNVEDALGLTGFMTKTSLETIFGKPTVMPTLETAGRMASMSRSFYDLNLGGMGVLTEPIRRLITKPEANELRSNPIPNMFPNWLPSQFLSGDAYSKIMKGELRLPGCITPNTFVLTDLGLKYAKDINVNDNVFTLDGYHKVEYVIPKYKNEEIFEIDAYSGLPVHVTGNHHILAIKTSQCKYHKTKDSSVSRRPCKPFHNKSFCKKCCLYNDYQYDWIPADELKKGDYVVLPKVKKTISSINQIKVIDIVKKFQIIEEKPNVFRYTRILNGKKIINNKPIDFPEYITFDEEFMYFAGYYLAEGSIGFSRGKVSSIILCVSLEEKYILDMFKEWLKRKYNIESNYKIGTGNYYIFSIYSVMFSLIISELFGYNKDKKINHKFTNIKYLLAGLFDGDGHVVNENIILTHSKKYRYSYQLPNILLQENIPYSIREKKFDIFTTKIPIIKINNELKYKKINDFCLHLKTSTFIELEDRFLIKIRNINKIQYKGKVYDYQVEKEHNYTTSFLMHNSAYLKTNPDTKMSMPARSSMWGAPLEDIVKYFTGSLPPLLKEEYDILEEGTLFHNKIQDSLAAENLLIQAEAKVYDVINDISGHVDAIIRDGKGGKGRRGLEIKSISDKGFQKLDAPKSNHVSQLNFYLHQLRFNNGTILYINRDNPSQVKTFELQYDKNRWERDVEKLKRGRQIARDMLKENVGDTIGYSYSWLDRLKILADVAPASNEYHEAKEIVMQQIKAGQFTQNEIDKFHTALKHRQTRLRKYELYPIRFKGKIMSPDTESNIQSINEDIKSGESYSLQERVIGAAWETFTNSNNALVNKFWARKDPLEHYKELRLYGKEYKPWDEPYSSFIEPFTRTALSKTNPIGGSISWGAGGYTIGGEFGALVGSVLGATYSTVNGLFRGLSNSVYVPDSVKEQRNLNTYFDKLKYERNNMMASLSQGITRDEFISARSATLESFNRESDPSIGNLFRATGNDEKPYIEAWINTTDPDERNNILNIVPPDLATALKRVWSRNDGKSFTKKRIQSISEDMGRQFYNFDQSVMDPRIELDDIKLKTIEDKGFEAHDFGLGWNEQLLRIKESQYEIPSANISEAVTFTPNLSSSQIRQQLYSLFNQLGIRGTANVYINNMDGPNVVNLTIRRDRSLAVINALRNRKQYGLE